VLVEVILYVLKFQGGDAAQLLLHRVHTILRHLHHLFFSVHIYEFRFKHFQQICQIDVIVDVLTHIPKSVHGEVKLLLFKRNGAGSCDLGRMRVGLRVDQVHDGVGPQVVHATAAIGFWLSWFLVVESGEVSCQFCVFIHLVFVKDVILRVNITHH